MLAYTCEPPLQTNLNKTLASIYNSYIKEVVKTKLFPCLTTPVCRLVVILTVTESDMIYYLTDFAVRRHKAELVYMVQVLNRCFWPCDVISGCHDFSINIEINEENRQPFKNAYFTRLHV